MQAMATNLVGLGMTMSQFSVPGTIMNSGYPNISNGAAYQQLLTQMALPNTPVATQFGNPAALSTMNNNSMPGSMGAIVAAMASQQQQQQQLQALSQVQQSQQSNSLFSNAASVAQHLPSSTFTNSQNGNALANGALAGLPSSIAGMFSWEFSLEIFFCLLLHNIWNSFKYFYYFLGANPLASLGGLNNMGSLASMSALNSNQVAPHRLVPSGPELQQGILKAVNSSIGNGQSVLTAPSNISAEQWESACSGAEQFIGKTVIYALSGTGSLIKCIGKHCSSTSCLSAWYLKNI